MPALVLAGGRARRLGGIDKCMLALDDRTVLAHLLERLGPAHPHIAISANGDPARFAASGRPVLADPIAGAGPLAGILAGLDWAASLGAEALLTVPGDTPFVPDDLARKLGSAPAVAASAGRTHPPIGLWPVDARAALRSLLDAGPPGRGAPVRALLAFTGARVVLFADTDGDPFADIDTPEDLSRARRRVALAARSGCAPC